MARRRGKLVVAGTGILPGGHFTQDARDAIGDADRVFYVVTNPIAESLLLELNPRAQDLHPLYGLKKRRDRTYAEMVETILAPVRRGESVCAAFYGHPGIFVTAGHEVIRQARAEGHRAEMQPGISAEDCLFADLNVDPAPSGCASFEATDFLISRRAWDPTAVLLLWQISAIGEVNLPGKETRKNVRFLVERLREIYLASHPVVVYEASWLAGFPPNIHRCTLGALTRAPLSHFSTLYVSPLPSRPRDGAMMQKLGLPPPR